MIRTRGRILVIRGGAIGDFILTLPVLSALRQNFPETHLEILGYPHIANLALEGNLVDRVESISGQAMAGFFARFGSLDERLQDYFADFSLIISFLYDPDGIFRENIARSTSAQFIKGPHRPDEGAPLHATDAFLRPLESLAIFGADPEPRLHLSPSADKRISRAFRLALHPGSGSEQKNWPEAKWALLLQHLLAVTDWHLMISGGEAEGERLDRLVSNLARNRYDLVRNRPLRQLARELIECDAYIGHDSGITHLAAALGIPGIVLWGPSNERIWRPRHQGMSLLQFASGLHHLPVASVTAELRRQGLHGLPDPTGNF